VRATIDTSAWVSAILSRGGRSAQLIDAFEAGQFTVITSEPAFAETEEVLSRPELIRSGEARRRAWNLLARLRERAEFVAITGGLRLCRDPKDDMVIETAILAGAAVLVSEDKDLNDDPGLRGVLAAEGVRVLTLAQFLDVLQRPSGNDGTE
jgi:putative PIN family toxin of toxin-antitoxin system